jgi:hypothetical protein
MTMTSQRVDPVGSCRLLCTARYTSVAARILEIIVKPALTLRDATVQDIQLELIRRTRFNTFDGEIICALLAKYRDHWQAVVFDRHGYPDYRKPGQLLMGGLINLRDLDRNIWNVDSVYVLTHTPEQARILAEAFEESGTGAMPIVYEDQEEIDMALGIMRQMCGLLKVWWD